MWKDVSSQNGKLTVFRKMHENRSTLRQSCEIYLKSLEHPGENSRRFKGERDRTIKQNPPNEKHISCKRTRMMRHFYLKRNSNTGSWNTMKQWLQNSEGKQNLQIRILYSDMLCEASIKEIFRHVRFPKILPFYNPSQETTGVYMFSIKQTHKKKTQRNCVRDNAMCSPRHFLFLGHKKTTRLHIPASLAIILESYD